MPVRTYRRVVVALIGLIAASSLSAFAADTNLSGTWTATVHIPKASSNSATLTLEQNGEALFGRITNSFGRDSEVTGTIVGTEIKLSYASTFIRVRTDAGDRPLVLNFEGTASNGVIDAKATTALGEATLKATKN